MKRTTIILTATLFLATCPWADAQKTEVTVRQGKVMAQTANDQVAVEAGQKAVLALDKTPVLTVDDPMVDDIMELYKWILEEKKAQRENIERTSVLVLSLERKDQLTFAALLEVPNEKSAPSDTFGLGPISPILGAPRFYDLEGRLLSFEEGKVNDRSASYHVRFKNPVPAGEKFRFILVSVPNDMAEWGLWKDGPLWNLTSGNSAKNSLNYYRVILPASAIFVDSTRPVSTVQSFNGRVAVTIRNFSGPGRDGVFRVAFLWPEKDHTSLADLPPQYRGLRQSRDREISDQARLEMTKILAGQTFEKQSDPLQALLTGYCALVQRDPSRLLRVIAPESHELAAAQFKDLVDSGLEALLHQLEFLSTPAWPEAPTNGTPHAVRLCRKGSLLCEAVANLTYQDGKWLVQYVSMGDPKASGTRKAESAKRASVAILKDTKAGLAEATYHDLQPGRFMRRWLFLGPVHLPWTGPGYFPDGASAKKLFDREDLTNVTRFAAQTRLGDKDYEWSVLQSEYGIVDLTQCFDQWFVVGYAWAQVEMAQDTPAVLGIGSDEGVKIWLNGELVHRHWTNRGVTADNDRVPVTFRKGTNQLVLKIQNGGGPWGFSCRVVE